MRVESQCEAECVRARSPRLVAGVLIVLIGVCLLLDRMGVIFIRDWTAWWPLFLIVPGITHLVSFGQPARQAGGLLLTSAGLVFLANNLGWLHVSFRDAWPILLIAVGALMIFRTLHGPGHSDLAASRGSLNDATVFGGGKRIITAKDFKGGELLAIFGGQELDLRDADIEGDHAVLRTTVIFGGGEIRVPRHWDVVARGTPVFGGLEDKTTHPRPEDGKPVKHLIVDAVCIFGGVSVEN